jgi:hypothetical protein
MEVIPILPNLAVCRDDLRSGGHQERPSAASFT